MPPQISQRCLRARRTARSKRFKFDLSVLVTSTPLTGLRGGGGKSTTSWTPRTVGTSEDQSEEFAPTAILMLSWRVVNRKVQRLALHVGQSTNGRSWLIKVPNVAPLTSP